MLGNNQIALRPLKANDSEVIHVWRNNLEIKRETMGIRFPITERMDDDWMESVLKDKSNKSVILGIEVNDDKKLIGLIQATKIDFISGTCEFGIQIPDNKYQGKGIGKESMRLFFDYLFNILNLRKITLQVINDNNKAISSYKKIGFEKEGVLEKQVFWEQKYLDVVIMRLFREKFDNS